MKINYIKRKITAFNDSIIYVITLALLTFFIWFTPSPYNIIFGVIYCLISFTPLLVKHGKNYLPLFIFIIPMASGEFAFNSIPHYFYFILSSIFLSMILKIIIYKIPIRKGDLSIPFLALIIVFLFSFIFNIVASKDSSSTVVVLYLVSLLFLILGYLFISTTLGSYESISYYSKCVVILSYVIGLEILVYSIKNNFYSIENISLGWGDSPLVSLILCFTIPFYSIIISNRKNWYYVFLLIPILSLIVLLVSNTGILFLMFLLIPLLLITFKPYGKIYPYISLFSVASFTIAFSLLLVFNDVFTSHIFDVFRNLFFLEGTEIQNHINTYSVLRHISDNYVIGTSISSMYFNNEIVFANNTILSTLVLGGFIGLGAYVIYEIFLYFIWFKKKSDHKFIFLIFLLTVEITGILSNSFYNLLSVLFILVSNACYQNSSRPDDVPIHNDFYKYGGKVKKEQIKTTYIKNG